MPIVKALKVKDIALAKSKRFNVLARLYGLIWNCTTNITKISTYFCNDIKYGSVNTLSYCKTCNKTNKNLYNYVPVNLEKLEKLQISHLNECLKEPDTLYYNCGTEKIIIEKYTNNVGFVYVETGITEEITVSSIPTNMNLYGEIYKLNSFVAYIKSSSHYVSFIYRKIRWEKYDDLMENATNIKFPHTLRVSPHLLLYTKGSS